MGPSVKFVSPNKGLISKKKMGANFFRVKNDQTWGGGARGGFGKRPSFFRIFFLNPSLSHKNKFKSQSSNSFQTKSLNCLTTRCLDSNAGRFPKRIANLFQFRCFSDSALNWFHGLNYVHYAMLNFLGAETEACEEKQARLWNPMRRRWRWRRWWWSPWRPVQPWWRWRRRWQTTKNLPHIIFISPPHHPLL